MHETFITAQHAARVAVAGMALRALLASARDADPGVASLALEATHPRDGESEAEIAVELRDERGEVLAGYTL
jgi:hypothetical protein